MKSVSSKQSFCSERTSAGCYNKVNEICSSKQSFYSERTSAGCWARASGKVEPDGP